MAKLMFTVVESFETGKGRLEILSDITSLPAGYRSGDVVRLQRPDGKEIEAVSGWIHTFTDPELAISDPSFEPALLFWLDGLHKNDVPVGTQILMLIEHPPGKLGRKWERIEKYKDQEHV